MEDDLVTACKYSREEWYLLKSGTKSWRQKLDSFQEGSLAGLEQGWAGWVLLRSLLYCCFLKGAAVGKRESPRSGERPGTGHEEGLRGIGAPQMPRGGWQGGRGSGQCKNYSWWDQPEIFR